MSEMSCIIKKKKYIYIYIYITNSSRLPVTGYCLSYIESRSEFNMLLGEDTTVSRCQSLLSLGVSHYCL